MGLIMIIPFLPFAIFTVGITIYSAFFYENDYCPKEWSWPQVTVQEEQMRCERLKAGKGWGFYVKDEYLENLEQLQIEERLKVIKDNQ